MKENIPYAYAAIIDVLGYRARLKADRDTSSLSFKDDLQQAMKVLSDVNELQYGYQAISDTIIITCANKDSIIDFLITLRSVHIAFLGRGLYIRGGMTYMPHFKSGQVTYSHALAKAHELESEHAIYPRIVIDSTVILMHNNTSILSSIISSSLVCEQNGTFFLDILDESNWDSVYDNAKKMYERDKDSLIQSEREFLKHQWFESYLFNSAHAKNGANRYIPTISNITSSSVDALQRRDV